MSSASRLAGSRCHRKLCAKPFRDGTGGSAERYSPSEAPARYWRPCRLPVIVKVPDAALNVLVIIGSTGEILQLNPVK